MTGTATITLLPEHTQVFLYFSPPTACIFKIECLCRRGFFSRAPPQTLAVHETQKCALVLMQ